ncbi:MAG: ABC transporter substrate-binding protein [Alphaproteobacteria bacterium]
MTKHEIKTLMGDTSHNEAIEKMAKECRDGEIDRREFLRTATLLGVTAASAYSLAGIAMPTDAEAAGKKGGTLRYALQVLETSDPANWITFEQAQIGANVCDYLCVTGVDGITRPGLAKSWKVSKDLKTWTFKIRKDVKWHNGDKFTAHDVKRNVERWKADNSKSSNKALFNDVKSIKLNGDYEITFKLKVAVLAIPENFYNYPTAMLHKSFDGSTDWAKNPIGTGPFIMKSHKTGQRAELVRNENYWGKKAYLDKIILTDLGNKTETGVAALISGQVDAVYVINATDVDILKTAPNVKIIDADSATTDVMRMNVNAKPFDNKKLRQAILACTDQTPYCQDVMRGLASPGQNTHISSVHPEYPGYNGHKQDYKKAKRLLKEAGYPNGLTIEATTGNTEGAYQQDLLQVLQRQLAPVGIKLKIKVVPSAKYWDVWNTAGMAITMWGHRPLGVMVWNLAYKSGMPWNESGYASKKFDKALAKASAIADVKERTKAAKVVDSIIYDDAILVQPHFKKQMTAASNKVGNFVKHPQNYIAFTSVYFK